MLAEFGIPQVHLQARYLQRRCYARMLSHRFGGDLPWFGSIRNDWVEDGITAEVVHTDVVVEYVPDSLVVRDKELAIEQHDRLWDDYLDRDCHMFYTNGSSSPGGSGAGMVYYESGLRDEAVSIRLPGSWCALKCEIFACYRALSLVNDMWPIVVFMDRLPVVEMLSSLAPSKRNAALVDLFAPDLNRIGSVTLVWIPGHCSIGGNVVTDLAGKRGCRLEVCVEVRGTIRMNVRNDAIAKELRTDELNGWHNQPGHDYYRRMPSSPRHFQGLRRWDVYVLVRMRSGAWDRRGHDSCIDRDDRFHLSLGPRGQEGRPAGDMLFKDMDVSEWVQWLRLHNYLGMNVVGCKTGIRNVQVVCGNPFDTGCLVSITGGITVLAKFVKPAQICSLYWKTSMGHH